MTSHEPPRREQAGFTLLELTIAMGILLAVSAALLSQLSSAQRSQRYAADRATAIDETRAAMARMTLDIRQASVIDPASTGTHLAMTTFVSGTSRDVTYDIVGANLWRTVEGRPAEKLQTNLASASIFTYQPDVLGAQIVSIYLQVAPPASPDTVIKFTSEARLRNIDPG